MSSAPARTWALVTTRPGRADPARALDAEPAGGAEHPHDRAPGAQHLGVGGDRGVGRRDRARGPVTDGAGSTRLSALMTGPEGGRTSLRLRRISDCCTSVRRRSVPGRAGRRRRTPRRARARPRRSAPRRRPRRRGAGRAGGSPSPAAPGRGSRPRRRPALRPAAPQAPRRAARRGTPTPPRGPAARAGCRRKRPAPKPRSVSAPTISPCRYPQIASATVKATIAQSRAVTTEYKHAGGSLYYLSCSEPAFARGGAASSSRHPHTPPRGRRDRRLRHRRFHRRPRLAGEGRRRALHRGLGGENSPRCTGAEPGLESGDRRSTTSRPPTAKPRRWRPCARSTGVGGGPRARATASTVVPVPIAVGTVAFGSVEEELELPYEDGGIAWDPSLVFPGLREGEQLEKPRSSWRRGRRSSPRDGAPLAEGPAEEREHPLGSSAIDVTGEVGSRRRRGPGATGAAGVPPRHPGRDQRPRAGVQRAPRRQAGRLAAGRDRARDSVRVLGPGQTQPGAPVKTTIDPEIQEAAVSALAGRAGGVAVLDTRNGDVRALAGQAFSAPQPPGSTFKMITTTAALQQGEVSLDDEFEITDGINVGGRFIYNAGGEYCGGTFREAFAESCNAVFAPLGPEIGNDDLVEKAEQFGFNSPPALYAPRVVREVEPAESTIPTEIGEEIDLGVSAIGQGEVLATPLQMATVAQTIANGGVREPTSIVPPGSCGRSGAGAGDVGEARRGHDRADDRRRHRQGPAPPGRSRRRRSPARRAPPSWARSRARRTRRTRSRSRTPGSPPSPRPKSRGSRSACC